MFEVKSGLENMNRKVSIPLHRVRSFFSISIFAPEQRDPAHFHPPHERACASLLKARRLRCLKYKKLNSIAAKDRAERPTSGPSLDAYEY